MMLTKRLTALVLALLMLLGMTALAEDTEEEMDMSGIVVVDGMAINEDGEVIEGFVIPDDLQQTVEILERNNLIYDLRDYVSQKRKEETQTGRDEST